MGAAGVSGAEALSGQRNDPAGQVAADPKDRDRRAFPVALGVLGAILTIFSFLPLWPPSREN
jgi:hypothetical protein